MHNGLSGTPAESLATALAPIRERYPGAEPEWIAEVISAVLACTSGAPSPSQSRLLEEVEELGRTIANAKAEIVALRIDDITGDHIPFATDELDAIIQHTASATNVILETCETLDALSLGLQTEAARTLQDATTQIYEACSFQDITGQRISKVVNTLKTIEVKVAYILATFGHSACATSSGSRSRSEGLLNGPQLPEATMVQTDIDKLLDSLSE